MQQSIETIGAESPNRNFRVGDWIVVPERSCMVKLSGESVELELMAIELLNYMANNPNQVLSIDALMDHVWIGKIVTQGTVRRIISILRKALHDDPKHPTYIRNIPKRGYILIAEVELDVGQPDTIDVVIPHSPLPEDSGESHIVTEPGITPNSPRLLTRHVKAPSGRRRTWLISGVLIVAAMSLALVGGLVSQSHQQAVLSPAVIALKGSEIHPERAALHETILFSHFAQDEKYWQLYSLSTDNGTVKQLTFEDAIHMLPSLSDDERKLAYVRMADQAFDLMLAEYDPELGLNRASALYRSDASISSVNWLDSNTLYFAARDERDVYSIFSLDASDRQITRLTHPPAGSKGDYLVSVSPNNQLIAVVRLTAAMSEIVIYRLNSMMPIHAEKADGIVQSIDWLNQSLVYLQGNAIKSIAAADNWQPNILFRHSGSLSGLSVAGNQLMVTVGDLSNAEIREAANPYVEITLSQSKVKISSNRPDYFAEHSKTSDAIYFISHRSGSSEIWQQSPLHGLQALTEFGGGTRIRGLSSAYHASLLTGVVNDRIFILNPDTREFNFVTSENIVASHPVWSEDGTHIYYVINGRETKELWTVDLASFAAKLLRKRVDRVLTLAQQSALLILTDGNAQYFYPEEQRDGDIVTPISLDHNEDWYAAADALYWTKVSEEGAELHRMNMADGRIQSGHIFPSGDTGQFSVSPDEKELLVTYFLPDQTDIHYISLED